MGQRERGLMYYRAYGLTIKSAIPLSHPLYGDPPTDLSIRRGAVRPQLENGKQVNAYITGKPSVCHFNYPGLARMLVRHGNEIIIDPATPHIPLAALQTVLMGVGICAVLNQRSLLTLHGASLVFADKGILLLGRSGAGKSTLAASLCAQGGRLLSDDISAVRLDQSSAVLLPGLPMQKLPKDTAAQLNLAPEALTPSFEDKWLVSQLSTYLPEPVPLHKIYLLRTRDATPLALTPLQGLPRLSAIMKNAFREKIIYAMQQQIRYSKQCFQLAETVPVSLIERPTAPVDVAGLTERVVQDLMR